MSIAEQLFLPDNHIDSVEDAITMSGVETLMHDGEYRPDVSYEYRMKRIQYELASAGVQTVMSSIYRRGQSEPLSYSIRRVDARKSNVIRLDDYR